MTDKELKRAFEDRIIVAWSSSNLGSTYFKMQASLDAAIDCPHWEFADANWALGIVMAVVSNLATRGPDDLRLTREEALDCASAAVDWIYENWPKQKGRLSDEGPPPEHHPSALGDLESAAIAGPIQWKSNMNKELQTPDGEGQGDVANRGHLNAHMIGRYFAFAHLPPKLQETSRKFCELAAYVAATSPVSAELSTCLRKLLEAKDAAVRARLG